MSKGKKIAFWIVFPIVSLLISFLLVFYLDLANGPIIILGFEIFALAIAITFRVLLRNKKFVFRMIPLLALVATNMVLLPLAKPSVVEKSAAYYANPVKTEEMELLNGKVQGVYNEDQSVRIYAGIPFAKPPLGDLRWKAPQEVENWSGIKDCSYFGPRAMQNDTNSVISSLVDMYSSKGWYPNFKEEPLQNMSEDCLYLNIWRPNNNKTDLPILVFIHGGSLQTGSSAYEDYNGEQMAKQDVIMITIQYRLGVFGYFAHQELIDESPEHTTGNYGLLDQIQALKWINKNAEKFGGDKTNITIAGESAGSSSVSALCSSPLAKDLFVRAIGESSSLVLKTPPHTYRTMEKALEQGKITMDQFKCSSIEELRKVKAEDLLKTKGVDSSMTLDGYALTKNPYEVYLAHENNEKQLLNGFNVKEADAFVVPTYLFSPTNKNNIKERLASVFGETVAEKIYNLYKDKIEEDAFSAFNEIFSVYWFMYPHQSWSKLAMDAGTIVYRYQFTKYNKFHETYHAGEMIYAYGNVEREQKTYRYNASDIELSRKMLSYWASFAKDGNPNYDGGENWPEYNLSDYKLMELGEHVGTIEDRYLSLYPLIEEFINEAK